MRLAWEEPFGPIVPVVRVPARALLAIVVAQWRSA